MRGMWFLSFLLAGMSSSKMSGLGMTLQTPLPLTEPEAEASDGKNHILTVLDESDQRFQEISIDFKNAGMSVNQVEMLQNGILWKRYVTEREMILEQRKKTGFVSRLKFIQTTILLFQ